ncbi:MAG: alpha/beta fold hydrolase [Wenzhouxiangella sp.]
MFESSLTTLALVLGIAVMIGLGWWVFPAPLARFFLHLDRQAGRLKSRRIHSQGLDWHYLEGGHGEPLVLLHGFNADAHHFCRVSRHLRAHFRILAPDLPGFGDTSADEGVSFRIEDIADRVLQWLDDLGVHHFYLGGNSMGGYIATAMARRAPDRVRGLWLLAPGGLHSAPLAPVLAEVAEDRHNPLVVRNASDFRRLTDYCFVRPPWIPGPVARFLAARTALHAVQAQRIFDAMRYDSRPMEELARDLNIPTLLVWGQSDQVLSAEGGALLEKLMPDVELISLADIGHLPMLEAPRRSAETWLAFTESRARRDQEGV